MGANIYVEEVYTRILAAKEKKELEDQLKIIMAKKIQMQMK